MTVEQLEKLEINATMSCQLLIIQLISKPHVSNKDVEEIKELLDNYIVNSTPTIKFVDALGNV